MAKTETVDMSPKMAVSKRIHPKIRVCLAADDIFFGPGAAELIELVEITGSLHEACSRMGLSYSKGRYIVKRLEEQLGMPVVRRWAGGVGGGGAACARASAHGGPAAGRRGRAWRLRRTACGSACGPCRGGAGPKNPGNPCRGGISGGAGAAAAAAV